MNSSFFKILMFAAAALLAVTWLKVIAATHWNLYGFAGVLFGLLPGIALCIGNLNDRRFLSGVLAVAIYSAIYEQWNPAIYYHLMEKLDITPSQRIATMSCGQRSQVALGLILAQQPDLIIFDDYSMGLDAGYRRLFIEVIHDYAADGNRSILLTSHIIQDLEGLIDDVVIYQRGRVLVNTVASELTDNFHKFSFTTEAEFPDSYDEASQLRLEKGAKRSAIYGFLNEQSAFTELQQRNLPAADIRPEPLTLEDSFIALTGKY